MFIFPKNKNKRVHKETISVLRISIHNGKLGIM